MIITGNRVLDALDFLKERVKALDTQLKGSLFRFEDEEEKRDPREILREMTQTHEKISKLQEVQAEYNLRVEVEVLGERLSLQRVLHLIGFANRVKSFWLQAASSDEQPNYMMHVLRQRTKEAEYAKKVISEAQAQELADDASRRALAFKQAIRSGNARELEMDVAEELFS